MTEAVPRQGSIKNKIVASDLEEERKNCNFDQKELAQLVWGGKERYERVKTISADFENDDVLRGTEKWYDFSREEQQENALLRFRRLFDKHNDRYFGKFEPHMTPWYTLGF